jgi:hypothetical protein
MGQQTKILGPLGFRPCRTKRGKAFLYLRNPLFVAPVFGHRPAALDRRQSQPEGKPSVDPYKEEFFNILV